MQHESLAWHGLIIIIQERSSVILKAMFFSSTFGEFSRRLQIVLGYWMVCVNMCTAIPQLPKYYKLIFFVSKLQALFTRLFWHCVQFINCPEKSHMDFMSKLDVPHYWSERETCSYSQLTIGTEFRIRQSQHFDWPWTVKLVVPETHINDHYL